MECCHSYAHLENFGKLNTGEVVSHQPDKTNTCNCQPKDSDKVPELMATKIQNQTKGEQVRRSLK